MVAPALPEISAELGIKTDIEGLLNLSIYVLALGIGPLLFGPLSEVYGRVRVLRYSNLIYMVFNLACGFAQTNSQMVALRFFSGLGGSAPLAVSVQLYARIFTCAHLARTLADYQNTYYS